MKRILILSFCLLLLYGCSGPTPDKGTKLEQTGQEIVYLDRYEVDPYWFEVEDVEDGYVILMSPLNTATGQIRVFNVSDYPMTCDLYVAPDNQTPVQSCIVEPEKSGVFKALSSEECYYIGIKPDGPKVDIVIQD